jgi:hypothetical protein
MVLHQPKLIITINYGTEPLEIRLIRCAHRHNIRTLSIIPSWDNLTSKGIIGVKPKFLSVWNTIMKDEALKLYNFHESNVFVNGALQFDVYFKKFSEHKYLNILKNIGLDINKPFIVIGTITPLYFPHNFEVVKILNEAVNTGKLPKNLQIVVRLHPQVIRDSVYGENLSQYHSYASLNKRIKLSIPKILSWGGISPPDSEDSLVLKALLKYCNVCIIPASTLAIDACLLNAPVIGIGFDGLQEKLYKNSIRRMYNFTHYSKLISLGGITIAENTSSLIVEIKKYLKDKSRHSEQRSKIAKTYYEKADGLSWKRIASTINQLSKDV